jgi:hypothetical protein
MGEKQVNNTAMKNKFDQDSANRRLLSAVVALAIRDACQHPGNKAVGELPRSALNFLFEHSDGYLGLLDIDAEQFRKRLINLVFSKEKKTGRGFGLSEDDCRKFRINYSMWHKEKTTPSIYKRPECKYE